MLAEFSIVPVGKETSISPIVAKALDLVDKSGLSYKVNPMGTVVEGSWDEVMDLIKKCHDVLLDESNRVITTIILDERTDKPEGRLMKKVESLEEKLGRKLKK